jgi:hypothetical protein
MILTMTAILLGGLCILGCLDRLRNLSWFRSKPAYVIGYLAFCLWSLWIVDRALRSDIEWYQLLGTIAVLAWLVATSDRWRHGPPADVSRPVPLDAPLRRLFK